MRRDRLFENESTTRSEDKVGAIVRKDDGDGNGVRAFRRRVHVTRPSLVVVVAVECQNSIALASNAVAAVVVAALAISWMNFWNIRGGAIRV